MIRARKLSPSLLIAVGMNFSWAPQAFARLEPLSPVSRTPAQVSASFAPSAKLRCEAVFTEAPTALQLLLQNTETIRQRYGKIQRQYEWQNWVENELNSLQFVRKADYLAQRLEKHATEIYGLDQYHNYARARDFLNQIPRGDFRLTPELIQKLHSLAYDRGGMFGLGFLAGYFGKGTSAARPTVFKKRNNYGEDPLKHPLTEDQYLALKNNPWLKGFAELPFPFSRKDKRRGVILYGDHREIQQKLSELIHWVESNRDTMDPIDLAAGFQHAFVSLHPFVDGNGRTSMLLMNRLLREFNLPPMIFSAAQFDIYMSPKDWAQEVRLGMQEFLDLGKEMSFSSVPAVNRSNFADAPTTNLLPSTPRRKDQKPVLELLRRDVIARNRWMEENLFPESDRKILRIGGERFLFLADGFFYNDKGIPHVLRAQEMTMYPISDQSYFLYGERGEARPTRFSRRRLSPAHREIFSSHFKALRAAEEGRLDLSQVRLTDYAVIARANKEGEIALYPWQREVFENSITIRDRDPFQVLAATRGYNTNFERSVEFGMKVTVSEVLAQYQLMDLKFQESLKFARDSREPDWEGRIQKSRGQLFQAAKSLLAQVEGQRQKLSATEQAELDKDPKWALYQAYLQHSALKYASFEEAMGRMRAGRIVLLRSDMNVSRVMGFRSNQSYIELAKSLPGYETLRGFIQANAQRLQAGQPAGDFWSRRAEALIPGFKSLVPRLEKVLRTHRFDERGIDVEFDREFVNHYLHSVNTPLKESVSFSTSTDLYIRTEELADGTTASKLPFTFTDAVSYLYFVEVNVGQVTANEGSKYFRQYEVLSFEKIPARRILRRVSLNELAAEADTTPSARIKAFMEEDYYLKPPKPRDR
ncbi:MAG: Fic family protein [Bdellovibrionaceae bacterium]|nr:Fic family protein [Pseudobdellovibrionaceae bacterium]